MVGDTPQRSSSCCKNETPCTDDSKYMSVVHSAHRIYILHHKTLHPKAPLNSSCLRNFVALKRFLPFSSFYQFLLQKTLFIENIQSFDAPIQPPHNHPTTTLLVHIPLLSSWFCSFLSPSVLLFSLLQSFHFLFLQSLYSSFNFLHFSLFCFYLFIQRFD